MMNSPQEFYKWLFERIHDGGKSALSEVVAIARDERDLELKGPAMGALICWKQAGIEAIVDVARSNPTSKNLSSAYKLLSATAAGGNINPTLLFIHNDELAALINDVISGETLKQ
jgi:hypothetical protein